MSDSIGRTGRHSEWCERHVNCPTTGKEECGKELNWVLCADGNCVCVTIFCFGCGQIHRVSEKLVKTV